MDAWQTTLNGVSADGIRRAIELCPIQYPDWPPTAGQFRAMCRSAPEAHSLMIPDKRKHAPIPANIQAEMNKYKFPRRVAP